MTTKWTEPFMDSMRQMMDPLADDTIAAVFGANEAPAVNAIFRTLVENNRPPAGALPPEVRQYLDKTAWLPSWTEPNKLALGEGLFGRYGPQIIALLNCYSLPFCYASRTGVQVLHRTSRLYTNPARRTVETAQMVFDVMSPGGLGTGGEGLRSAQKVRLMHAAVRRLTLAAGDWNTAELGPPINQEDLAGTLLAFSWVVVDGLRKLGVQLSAEEGEAYLHAWNVVGYVMGIREELLPANLAEAEALARNIQRRQYAACPEGQEMTRALLQMLAHYLPGNLFDHFPSTLLRELLGQEVGDLLGVPRPDWTEALIEPLRLLGKLEQLVDDRSAQLAQMSELFGRQLMQALLWISRGGNRPRFTIPTELKQSWGINWVE